MPSQFLNIHPQADFPLVYMLSMVPHVGISLSCPVTPLSSLCPHSLLTGRARDVDKSCECCSATTETSVMLSTSFSKTIQDTALGQLPARKLTLSQLNPGHWVIAFCLKLSSSQENFKSKAAILLSYVVLLAKSPPYKV